MPTVMPKNCPNQSGICGTEKDAKATKYAIATPRANIRRMNA
jgi:hypothetical protein